MLWELCRDCKPAAPNEVVWDLLIGNSHRFGDFTVGVSDSPVLGIFNEELSLSVLSEEPSLSVLNEELSLVWEDE
jgi:hypothetical protein